MNSIAAGDLVFLRLLETVESENVAQGRIDEWVTLEGLAERSGLSPAQSRDVALRLSDKNLVLLDNSTERLLIRSKTACILRNLYHLRTRFQRREVRDVSDLRYIRFVKQIPRQDLPLASLKVKDRVLQALGCESSQEEEVISRALDGISSMYDTVSKFQLDAALKIIGALTGDVPGNSIVIQAETGAGKSLVYQLPLVLRILLKKTRAYFSSQRGSQLSSPTAILLFPRNILAKDQFDMMGEIGTKAYDALGSLMLPSELLQSLRPVTARDFGGVGYDEKVATYSNLPDILVTNPDTLKRRLMDPVCARFYASGVEFVLYDEVHLYYGLFGAHVASLNSRLQNALPKRPIFVGMSATIANPQKHCQKLFALQEAPHLVTDQESPSVDFSVEHHVILKPRAGRPPLGVCIDATSCLLHNRRVDTWQAHRNDNPEERPKSLCFVDSLDLAGRWSADQRNYEFFDTALQTPKLRFDRGYPVHFSPWADDGAVPQATCRECKSRVNTLAALCPRFGDGKCWWFSMDSGDPARWVVTRAGLIPGDNIRVRRVTRQEVDFSDLDDIYALFRNPGPPFDAGLAIDALVASPILEVGVDFRGIREIIQYGEIRSPSSYKQKSGRGAREGDLEEGLFVLSILPFTPLANFYYRHFQRLVYPSLSPLPLEPRNPDVIRAHALCSLFDLLAREGMDLFNIIRSREDPDAVEEEFRRGLEYLQVNRQRIMDYIARHLRNVGETESVVPVIAGEATGAGIDILKQLSGELTVGASRKTLVRWIFEAFRNRDVMQELEDAVEEKLEQRGGEVRLLSDSRESLRRTMERISAVASDLPENYESAIAELRELAARTVAEDRGLTENLSIRLQALQESSRWDRSLTIDLYNRLMEALSGFMVTVGKLAEARKLDESLSTAEYEHTVRLKEVLEDLRSQRSGLSIPPSYLYDVAPSLCSPPYTIPRTLSEAEGREGVFISTPGRIVSERAELAMALLFPGSTTFRYGGPMKIQLGRWFQSGRADLSARHELSPKPEFELEIDGTKISVHKPLTLRAAAISGRELVCRVCLSLSDGDENCNHAAPILLKLPSSHPVILKRQLNRESAATKRLTPPLSDIITDVSFLPKVEIGVAATGFERTASTGGGQRVITVDYRPPIGFKLVTSGVSFRIASLDAVMTSLIAEPVFHRDMIAQVLSHRLLRALRQAELPSYHHELLASSLMRQLGLDSVLDLDEVNRRLMLPEFDAGVSQCIQREQTYYESLPLDPGRILVVLKEIRRTEISKRELADHVRDVIMHSLGHAILIGCAVTSGSQLEDLDYLVRGDEVVVFDSASGGNGSSAMCFQFLTQAGAFNLREYLGTDQAEELHRPRNLDETLFELLLPCLNGVSDRVFFYGKVPAREAEVRRRIVELQDKDPRAIQSTREYGLASAFPISIGYHAMSYSASPQDAERFKETCSQCLHGCPECISLGKKCSSGFLLERFSLSKYALDRLVLDRVTPFLVDELDVGAIQGVLRSRGLAVLKVKCSAESSFDTTIGRASELVSALVGGSLDGKFVKFAGHWMDLDRENFGLVYYYLLTVL